MLTTGMQRWKLMQGKLCRYSSNDASTVKSLNNSRSTKPDGLSGLSPATLIDGEAQQTEVNQCTIEEEGYTSSNEQRLNFVKDDRR